MFSYVYYTTIIRVSDITVASVLQMIRNGLTRDEQLELLASLNRLIGSAS